MRTIEATGYSAVRAQPDAAILRVGVTIEAEKPEEAVTTNAKRMTDVLAAIEALGVPESAIRTSELELYPKTKWDEQTETELVIGYVARHGVVIHASVDKAVAIYDAAVMAGANTGGRLEFIVTDAKKYRHEALAQATKAAVAEIHAMAKALGVTLAGMLQAQVMVEPEPEIYELGFGEMDKVAAKPATPIMPGRLDIEARVRVMFTVRP